MNRKIETFKRCLLMQKTLVKVMHSKIVFVKVESIVTEISESVHWSRRCYAISFISVWNEILLESQETDHQTASCQHTLTKKLVQHIGEVRSCKNRNKTYVPVFYRGYKIWVLVLVRVIESYAIKLVPMFYYRDKTRVQMFYFLNKWRLVGCTIYLTCAVGILSLFAYQYFICITSNYILDLIWYIAHVLSSRCNHSIS